ncbi:MAG TPA: YihY/virulence factor BrkB family protein [Thermoanaerobaculia bacterium]|nr:YihY/virulence factor BrkB family protein [Thermoanaerobaculia bacterium]
MKGVVAFILHPSFHTAFHLLFGQVMKQFFQIFKQTVKEFGEDKAPRLGAALAYYTIFSIGPLLLIAISVAGLVWGEEAAQGRISEQLQNVFGANAADAVETMIAGAGRDRGSGIVAMVLGIVTLLFGASGVFAQLEDALNTIWNVARKKSEGIKGVIKDRFLSMVMVLGVGFLLLVSLVLDAVISAMGDYLTRVIGGEAMMQAIQLVVSLGVVTLLFAMMFKYLPDIEIEWRDVWLGAAFTSLLFVIGKFAIGLYLGKAAVGSSYGAAGSLVILLLWIYYSAQILFFGAEFTQVYARSRGSMKGDTSKARARAAGHRLEDRPKGNENEAGVGVRAAKKGGGAGKLVAGGAAGFVLGTIVGALTAGIVAVKSVKKLLTMPFR